MLVLCVIGVAILSVPERAPPSRKKLYLKYL
jgi:hypothetical protein